MNILIIGGNRFFGKRIAELFLQSGHDVTLLNRQNLADGLNDKKIFRIKCDRSNAKQLAGSLKGHEFDVVIDQVCFEASEALAAVEIFKNRTKKYIFTSTQSVYKDSGPNLSESVFNPVGYSFQPQVSKTSDYGEAKRQCEAVFFAQASMPVTAVRLPMVFGPDDYTGRFQFHVDRIKQQREIFFPNINAKLSLIHSADAALGIHFLAQSDFTGPINLAANPVISLKELMDFIEGRIGKALRLSASHLDRDQSPYGIESDWYMNTDLAASLGLRFDLHSSLKSLKI
jgi:nucleoside-diphosphate-sugar epimerase